MKTQKRHRQRQILHSWEIMQCRRKKQEALLEKKWRNVGYGVSIAWLIITLGFYVFMG